MSRILDATFGVCFTLAILSFWAAVISAFFIPGYVVFLCKALVGFVVLALLVLVGGVILKRFS